MGSLFDSVVSDSKVYKGAGRVVWGAKHTEGGPDFPSKIEDVINLSTFVLASGWNDIGGTNKDGVKVTRSVEMEDGVETDQLAVAILTGTPKQWKGGVALTMLHTDVDSLRIAFASDAPTSIDGSQGSQKKLAVGSPTSLPERQLCVIQKHSSLNKYRMITVRRAIMAADEVEMAVQSGEASAVSMKWDMNADLDQSINDNMFVVFEMTQELA